MGDRNGVEVPASTPRRNPGDEDRPGGRQTGEQVCPACGGSGRVDDGACATCGGNGRVVAIVGDA